MQVFQIREEKREQMPVVTDVDGSGRLQTVYRHTNPRYYRLIEYFQDLTGRADGVEDVVQRERAGGLPTRRGTLLLSAHQDGSVGDRRDCHVASMRCTRASASKYSPAVLANRKAHKSMPRGADHFARSAEGCGAAKTMRCVGVSKPYQRVLVPMPLPLAFIACYSRYLRGDQGYALYLFTSTFNCI